MTGIGAVGALLAVAALHAQDAAPLRPWRLVWNEEFDGPAGSAPDRAKWTYDLGQTGWGNAELENYTSSTDNAFVDGAGHLVIQTVANGASYTSARLKTQGLAAFTYGKIEARIQIPFGQGLWPAFWMLGTDISTSGWPRCGEIDIMENIGKEPSTVHGTVHGPGYSGGNGIGAPFSLPDGQRFADKFHVFTVLWDPQSVEFQVDGHAYKRVTPADLPSGTQWVYGHPFFLLLNVAVGGNWPGYPDSTTRFPQRMLIDWVRVYSRGTSSLPVDR
ncbi:MAG TPA: glycoside hydrolase family 16 protein [Terriglobales bacterium]|nr:glycoside hydrolase family 16 protein [Terriglobales bacterium]